MIRLFVVLIMLASGCATTAPPERLAGCWIARGDDATRTMRWLPDAARPGVLNGELIAYGAEGAPLSSARFTLEPRDSHWIFCSYAADGAPRCSSVAQGQRGSLEGGRVFIDADGETLRIAVIGEGPEREIFQGRRDGCD
jgi:hypothetical protein